MILGHLDEGRKALADTGDEDAMGRKKGFKVSMINSYGIDEEKIIAVLVLSSVVLHAWVIFVCVCFFSKVFLIQFVSLVYFAIICMNAFFETFNLKVFFSRNESWQRFFASKISIQVRIGPYPFFHVIYSTMNQRDTISLHRYC